MSGFTNQPKILRGAFVEYGLSLPPLLVVFQFNPLTISRTRTASAVNPQTPQSAQRAKSTSLFGQAKAGGLGGMFSTDSFRQGQTLNVQSERLNFDIRLDATDKLNADDALTKEFGIAPQVSTLELMMLPKSQSILGGAVSALLGGEEKNFAFFDESRDPPIILFVWGRKKVLAVNITSMQIREEQFSTDLNPTRAVIGVSLEVLEGPNAPYLYTKTLKEVMSLLNLANIGDVANTMVPA